MNRRRPVRPLLAIALAIALGLALAASDRNRFPGRRQGGGSQSQIELPIR